MSLSVSAARARHGSALRPSTASARVGDPGLLGFLGKVGKAALNVVTGGIGGTVIDAAGSLIGGGRSAPAPAPRAPMIGGSSAMLTRSVAGMIGGTPPPIMALPRLVPGPGAPQRLAPTMIGSMTGGAPTAGTKLACPSGFHPNKSSYFLKDGTFVPEGSRCVKNRRRDPMNPRALRRAIARVDAGKSWQSKLSEITTSKYTAAGNRKD